ncbi:hemolysin family protein [Gimesia sp.]|uniref:hemolysin family protein n=1 Tax=Gimesia sp. TaxID=2024833 RepID=UPI003A8EEA97
MPSWLIDLLEVGIAIFLVALNGFFVAAEFSLVKVRGSQIQELVRQNKPFAQTALWLVERLEDSLSACQLGITMASLGLGWVGEPAFARLLEPVFSAMGVTSPAVIHGFAFAIAFSLITALHLVIGEQAPKIFAIRHPEKMVLWCAVPMKFFYVFSYPLLISLNGMTAIILKNLGVKGIGHDTPHSEDEIRTLLKEAHIHGDLTRSEHRLLDAVFEFDDIISRRIMVPRTDVEILLVGQSLSDCLTQVRRSRHTRFPLCEGSLDKVVGVVHIKELIRQTEMDDQFDLRSIARPPKTVPENMPISKLLRHFQATHQHMAFIVDEYGTVIGIVTMENVIEQIVGSVQDEFDLETPDIVPDGPGQFIVQGSTPIDVVEKILNIYRGDDDVDTFSGLLMSRQGQILEAGDRIDLTNAVAEVLETKNSRAERVRVTLNESPAADRQESGDSAG